MVATTSSGARSPTSTTSSGAPTTTTSSGVLRMMATTSSGAPTFSTTTSSGALGTWTTLCGAQPSSWWGSNHGLLFVPRSCSFDDYRDDAFGDAGPGAVETSRLARGPAGSERIAHHAARASAEPRADSPGLSWHRRSDAPDFSAATDCRGLREVHRVDPAAA